MQEVCHSDFSSKILTWFSNNKRDLPWRDTKDPYHIWLSEIILQQTRVNQGLPYYYSFINNYQTIHDLAEAEQEHVLRTWQGLGYYSRARNLHFTAKQISKELEGRFPETYAELRKLKGVGDYTAAAIASFAYNERVAVVDGNVFRVLARVFGISEDILSGKGKKIFTELANQILPKEDSDLYNQAIMEFGALHCTPKKPLCQTCPFQKSCIAFNSDLVNSLPVKKKAKTQIRRDFTYLVVRNGNEIFLKRRTGKDIWEGLYEFFLIEEKIPENNSEALKMISEKLFYIDIKPGFKISKEYKHILSHQKIYARFIELEANNLKNFNNLIENKLLSYSIEEIEELPKPILIDNYLQEAYF